MRWLFKLTFWLLVVLLVLGVYFFWDGLQEEFFSPSYSALTQVFSQGFDRFFVSVVIQELRLSAVDVEEAISEGGENLWKVRGLFNDEESRREFSERMANLCKLLPYLGFYGERRVGGSEEIYTFFFRGEPRFLLKLEVRRMFQVALVIDDLGYDLNLAEKILDLPIKCNVAILPDLPHTGEVADLAKKKGKEILIHFPMEALDERENAREKFLLRTDASPQKVEELLQQALAAIPGARGLNNHKGSRATSSSHLMEIFFQHLKGRKLYFLDSLTSPHSVAFQVARKAGIPAFRRDIFLDTYPSEKYAIAQLGEAIRIAKRKGYAVVIGHARENTYRALVEFFDHFSDPEVEFVFLSEIQKEESM
ncbi:MAG: divergent polysaccharide deacetylase family protein [Candidatus Caldatribacteriaceae bacterium]